MRQFLNELDIPPREAAKIALLSIPAAAIGYAVIWSLCAIVTIFQ